MSKYKLLQLVDLTEDIPQENLTRGMRGAIVLIFTDAEAYEIEFVDEARDTLAELALTPNRIRAVDLKNAAT